MTPLAASRRWGWIGGWGVSTADFTRAVGEAWPDVLHTVFLPDAHAVDQMREGNFDVVAGYSLGGLLLLAEETWPVSTRLLVVAPILAFDAEEGMGGTSQRATRLAIHARFEQNAAQALRLFQRLSGMVAQQGELPYARDDLAWGLDALGRLRAHPGTAQRAEVFVGENDPLISLPHLLPNLTTCHILPGLGHDFRQLLPAIGRAYR